MNWCSNKSGTNHSKVNGTIWGACECSRRAQVRRSRLPFVYIVVCVEVGLTGPEVNRQSQNIKKSHKLEEVFVSVLQNTVRGRAENQSLALSSLLSGSMFVVWFLWNNLIKVAGWLNSERKLGYICLSFPLKSFSHPATLLPGVTAVFIIFSLFERREKVREKKAATISLPSQLF